MALFQILPCRLTGLEATVEGFERTGVPLVAYNPCGTPEVLLVDGLGPAGYTDDLGAYYFIPKLVEIFGFNVDTAVQLLYSGTVFLAFLLGAIGSWLYCDTKPGKAISVLCLAILAFIIAGIGDSYTYMGSIPMALIPWSLYLQRQNSTNRIVAYFILAGMFIACGHLIRSNAGTPALIFICLSLLFFSDHYSRNIKTLSVLALIVTASLVMVSFDMIVQQRVDFLISIDSSSEWKDQRSSWTIVYKSLGYLWNNFGFPGWYSHEPLDSYALAKALSIRPDFVSGSIEMENLLRYETFQFIKQHPLFFIQTIFAKFGVTLFYILLFANIGLVLAIYYSRGIAFNLLFLIGTGLSMIYPIFGLPIFPYMIGVFTFATLFNIYVIDHAIQIRRANNLS